MPPVCRLQRGAAAASLHAPRPRPALKLRLTPPQWAFQAAMSNDADREEHTHDPPPPEGTHLDRFGFICPLSESVSQSKEEAALELRCAGARGTPAAADERRSRGVLLSR